MIRLKKEGQGPSGRYPGKYTPYLLFMASLIILAVFRYSVPLPEKPVPADKKSPGIFPAAAVEIPATLDFAGERVPLEFFDVRESLDRELLVNVYWHSQTLLLIKKAHRYFPMIEKVLAEYRVPDDFKYLPLAESGLANSRSPAGAVGFWQFLEGTAREYGLVINQEVDERYHYEKSTRAACRFLLDSYEKYGNWTLVAASYNNGRKGLDEQIRIQKQNDYYNLLLNEETARYVFRILSFKCILSDPGKYGFQIEPGDLYAPVPTYKVEINQSVEDFADFASSRGTNYKILKFFNPWLRKQHLTNHERKTYTIELPKENARIYSER